MPNIDIGNIQTGLNADTSFVANNGELVVPPGGILPIGFPVARNLLAVQSGYLSQFAAVPGLGSFANGDSEVTLTNTGAGWCNGVYVGQPVTNPWLNQPANTLNTSVLNAEVLLARTGARVVLVGALNGGTSVKIGDNVGKSAVTGASTTPFLLSQAAAIGSGYGTVIGFPIWTTITTAVASGSGIVIPVWNTDGIPSGGGVPLVINPGQANQEQIVPTASTADAPAVSALTVASTAGSAAVAQITFNLAGFWGSTGVAPSGTATTTFTLLVPITNGWTATQTAAAIVAAVQNSGFGFGGPQNILGIGAGTFSQTTGAPQTGPLVYASNSAGVVTFSAVQPGIWANTLLTYTVTVIGGTTQTFNTNVAGSATPVAFSGGVAGTITATLQNPHVAGEPIVGWNNLSIGSVGVAVPGTAGMQNVALALVDLVTG